MNDNIVFIGVWKSNAINMTMKSW